MKACLRLVGLFLLLCSFLLVIADGTLMISEGRLTYTGLGDLLLRFAGGTRPITRLGQEIHPLLADGLAVLMHVPAMLILLAVGLLAWLLSRRKEPSLRLGLRG